MSSNSVVLAMKIVPLAIVGSSGTRNNFSSNSVALALKIVQFAKVGCSGKGGTGEISSDLYGLSGCDFLNLTFCRLDFHQLLIKIS